MYNWDYIKQEISEIILKHTTKISSDDAGEFTATIIDAWLSGISFENIVANEKPADVDEENLKKAAAQIDLAIKSIAKVGYLGKLALKKQMPEDLIQSLEPLSEQLKVAANMLNSSDRGLIAILSGVDENPQKEPGRKRNFTAHNITEACAIVFQTGTNSKASVTRSAYSDSLTAEGKFHSFLSEIFELLEISASAEHCIKELRTEENGK